MYSIYKKMIRKKIPVRQVYDARALRIIVDDEGGTRTQDAWVAAYRCAPQVDQQAFWHSEYAVKAVRCILPEPILAYTAPCCKITASYGRDSEGM